VKLPDPDSGDIYTLQVSLAGKPFTPATPDIYSFNLDAGESATVAVTALSTGNVSVELQNSAGTTVATGSGPRINVAEVISNFVAPATGTYFAVVGSGGVDYGLLVTRNANFDTEDNNDLASAREVPSTPVAGRQWVLGSLGTGPSLTVDAADSEWWDSTGSHDASNPNYLVGTSVGTQYRDFFVFDLSAVSLPIIGAQLRLSAALGLGGPGPTETYTVFDVTTPIPALEVSGSGQTGIFADLGTGASFGTTTVSKADSGGIVSITLNAAALASLNASSGGLAAPFIWKGYENAGDPLRKALGIEIETDQEGGSIEGTGEIAFDVSALDAVGQIDSTGSGAVAFDVCVLAASGNLPTTGSGSMTFVVSALAGSGTAPSNDPRRSVADVAAVRRVPHTAQGCAVPGPRVRLCRKRGHAAPVVVSIRPAAAGRLQPDRSATQTPLLRGLRCPKSLNPIGDRLPSW